MLGLETALEHVDAETVFVLPCDLSHVETATLAALADYLERPIHDGLSTGHTIDETHVRGVAQARAATSLGGVSPTVSVIT